MHSDSQILIMRVETSVSMSLETSPAANHIDPCAPDPAVFTDSEEQEFEGSACQVSPMHWLPISGISSRDVLLRCLRHSCARNRSPQTTRVGAAFRTVTSV